MQGLHAFALNISSEFVVPFGVNGDFQFILLCSKSIVTSLQIGPEINQFFVVDVLFLVPAEILICHPEGEDVNRNIGLSVVFSQHRIYIQFLDFIVCQGQTTDGNT